MGRIQKLREQKKLEEQTRQEQKSKRTKKIITGVAIGVGILIIIIYGSQLLLAGNKKIAVTSSSPVPTTTASPTPPQIFPSISASPTATSTNVTKNTIVNIETARGNIKLELYDKDAPKTVANFVKLINQGFYDGIKFHRVVPGFVIQAGDPQSKTLPIDDPKMGTGGPGYTFADEINPWSLGLSDATISSLEAKGYTFTHDLTSHKIVVGTLAMANSGPNTNGSQFFIVTEQDQPQLDGQYTVFGQVIEGMDVVRQIQQGDIIKTVSIVNQ
jgi:peptidyl-prolyl cis-trans isomerase B (cyclophilin B)